MAEKMQFRSRRHLGPATIAGALGGLIGAWVKLGWEAPWSPRPPGRIPEPMDLVSLFTHVSTPVWESYLVYVCFSILSGVIYGALVEFFPIVALGTGVAFGLAIWIGAHEIIMPLLHLTPPPWQLTPSEQASEFFGYALWGWAIGVFVAYYRARIAPRKRADSRSDVPLNAPLPVPESVSVF